MRLSPRLAPKKEGAIPSTISGQALERRYQFITKPPWASLPQDIKSVTAIGLDIRLLFRLSFAYGDHSAAT